jgi:hypothetical protein
MSLSTFVGSFNYENCDTAEEGSFQLVVEAQDGSSAAEKCRARLDALADTSDALGPVEIRLDALVRVARDGLAEGVIVNLIRVDIETGTDLYEPLPFRRVEAGDVLEQAQIGGLAPSGEADESEDDRPEGPPFWSDGGRFRPKWKLYWCETDDHDEDCMGDRLSL